MTRTRRGFCLGAAGLAGAERRPNVVLVLTDDQGYGDMGWTGNPVVRTPNLDRLAGEGARFTDFHVSPTCAPTRAAVLTGRHEFKVGVTHTILERERMSLRAVTLGQVMKGAGYGTGIFGKWHLGDEEAYQPGRRGFDEVFVHGCGGIGQTYAGSCGDVPGNRYFDPWVRHNGRFEKTSGYCTDVFFGAAMQWMEARRGPWFAMITPNAAHAPLDCPAEYMARYEGMGLTEMERRFYGMVTNIDDNVGRLTARLKQWGVERETVVIFMTDNGGTVGVKRWNAGRRGGKVTPYQGGTRAAGIWRWPGTIGAGERKGLAAHLDVMPTLAEMAGTRAPAGDGRSLMPLLRDAGARWANRYLYTHVGRWDRGKARASKYARCRVRDERWSMVNVGAKWELYDLAADVGETRDVVGENAVEARRLEGAYDKWWDEVLPLLENEEAVGPAVNPYREAFERQTGGAR